MIAKKIAGMIEERIARVNTISPGKITEVHLDDWTVNVRLKHKVRGQEVEIFNVPVAPQSFGAGSLLIAPAVGDVVLVGFSKYELHEQLKNRDIVAVNELVKFNINHAIVLAGITTQTDSVPAVGSGEILLQHHSGAYLKIKDDGSMELKATRIDHTKLV